MSDRPENIKHRLISEEAADWLLRLREGSLSDRQEYVRWLKRSPTHVREMLELSSLEGLLRSSDLSGMRTDNDYIAPHDRSERVSSIVELTPSHEDEGGRQSPWRHWKSAASACLSRIEFAGRAISKFVGIRS